MTSTIIKKLSAIVENSILFTETDLSITKPEIFQKNIGKLVEIASLGDPTESAWAKYLIRSAGLELGIIPASIQNLYMARGAGKVPNTFTVPAINLRVLTFQAAKAVIKVAMKMNAGAILFEIARSEIGYTDQRPSEFISHVIAAAIAMGYKGPVFIQGDHFQVSPGRYSEDPELEINTIKNLSLEAIEAGFYNIDVDTSTLVDLDKESIEAQQALNTELSADISAYIRSVEPSGVTISIGGEIGEVGAQNSTKEELEAYVEGYNHHLKSIDPNAIGLSKISIQTGTSHGGVVLPDGSIASVNLDFDTLKELSDITRDKYKMGGAVQHGASTLPQEAFGKFVEAGAIEVHLATNFQNIFYEHAPEGLLKKIHAYLKENHSNERKPGMTDDQFYYKTRKRAFGIFKREIMSLPEDIKNNIANAWEEQFTALFESLAIENSMKIVELNGPYPKVMPKLSDYLKLAEGESLEEDVSDLAD